MHVAYLCWFEVIWSCWRANWKKRTWSCQTTRPLGRVDASRPQETTRPPSRVPPWESLDHITRPPGRVSSPPPPDHHSIGLNTSITFTRPPTRLHGRVSPSSHTRPITLPPSRVPPSPSLDFILDCQLQSLLHSALNQTLKEKEEKKTPTYRLTNHSTTWVECRS